MNFVDRKVPYPNRIKLTRVPSETDLYTIERAEGVPIVEGTPLNASTFNQLSQEIAENYNTQVNNISAALRDKFYPVGTIYLSLKNTSPASSIGGDWLALTSGPYLRIGAATETAGNNGGSATITESNMPSHIHKIEQRDTSSSATSHNHYSQSYVPSGPTVGNSTTTHYYGSGSAGSGTDYYPVYKNVYAWRRVS